jgi:hypothetical protein
MLCNQAPRRLLELQADVVLDAEPKTYTPVKIV